MDRPKRLSGIYDLRTLNFLIENRVRHFVFDFRPTSMNFIQEYKALELLDQLQTGVLYLLFSNEKTFMIERIAKSCRDHFGGEIILEIEGQIEKDFFDLNLPFLYRLQDKEQLTIYREALLNGNCRGHVLSYDMLKDLHENGGFLSWVKEYYGLLGSRSLDIKQDLLLDWDSDIFPSLFEYLDFDTITLPINTKVEVCYRNVDLNKVSTNIKHLTFSV